MIGTQMRYRAATSNAVPSIFTLLREVAPEIPLVLDSKERQEAAFRITGECVETGESWVAIGDAGCIIGFILVKPDKMERFLKNNQALHLRYAGVTREQRNRGVFSALIRHAMSRKVPLTAIVKAGNRSGMAARLTKIGFHKCRSDSHLGGPFHLVAVKRPIAKCLQTARKQLIARRVHVVPLRGFICVGHHGERPWHPIERSWKRKR